MPHFQNYSTEAIPAELREHRAFVVYRLEERHGKPSKVPYSSDGTRASVTDARTWNGYEAVQATPGYDGIGFVFSSGDPYTGIDLDGCIDTDGNLRPWAAKLLETFTGSAYIERSQSGTGLHLIVKGKANWQGKHVIADGEAIEVYSTERYFVMTGNAYGDVPERIGDAQAELNTLCAEHGPKATGPKREDGKRWSTGLSDTEALDAALERYGDKVARLLYQGDHSGYEGDQSSADYALVGMLAYACGPNPEQIDRLFRLSKLYRAKWDRRTGGSTYGADTIAKVLATRKQSSYHRSASQTSQRIELRSVTEVFNWPQQQWVITDWLEQSTLAMLYGPSSTYKSFAALDMALSVALGRPWQGHATRQGAVLYIAAEGIVGMRKRLRAWAKHHGLDLSAAPLHFIERAISFFDLSAVDRLQAILAEQGTTYSLIVVDTLSRNSVGANENDNSEMVQVLNHMQEVASATGAAVLMVHHITKSTGTMRGASAVLNSVDSSFKAERDELGHVQLSTDKQKDHDDSGVITLEREIVTLPDGDSSLVLRRVGNEQFCPQQNGQRNQRPPYAPTLDTLSVLCVGSPDGVARREWERACMESRAISEATFERHRSQIVAARLVRQEGRLYKPAPPTPLEGMMS